MSLTPEQFGRLERLFAEALDLPVSERAGFVDRVRKEEGSVMAGHLELMLASEAEPTESMFQPLFRPEVSFSAEESPFRAGEIILNRFRIIRLLGRGGMGEVYEAQDSEIGRVALKTIRQDVPGYSSLLRRFKQEVQLARMVTSSYVCRIHEFFMLPAEHDRAAMGFMTMEFLDGITLADRIAGQGPLPWRDAQTICVQLCQGLEAIHSAGIIHRDFKSRNVMLTVRNGVPRAVVMDLGLAYCPEQNDASKKSAGQLTMAGTIMGTPDYMAPEQFESGTVSAETDIYAFGVVLYEMVTGKLPFEASTPMAAAVRRAKRPSSASSIQPSVPHGWDGVIEKCLEYEPAQRFQSARELASALQRRSARTASLRALMASRPSRRWMALVLAFLVLLVAAVLAFNGHWIWPAHTVPEAAQTFYLQATDAFGNGTYLTAVRQLQEALRLDSGFTLAHARLADAFNELDSTGEAQREVAQINEELVAQLPSLQRTYVNAVSATIRLDAGAAIKDYEKLLNAAKLPAERANALVDLGRAEERVGEIGAAMERYTQAILLNPYSPAPVLRRGILESRQGKQREADADFAGAEKLYTTKINLEGMAEVAYQRSYVASKLGAGHEKDARKFFQDSKEAAERMQSAALQARALSRLSAIEFGSARDEEAGKVAEGAIRLAEENGVPYWATDARLRLGNSWTYRDEKEAEKILKRANAEAQRNQWPRLLALSQLSLATLSQRQQTRQRQQQVVDLASPAYEYYRIFGFAQESFQCQVLLSRAKAVLGFPSESLDHARKALDIANTLGTATERLQAQEAAGSALLSKEDYPAALEYFGAAFHIAEEMGSDDGAYFMSVEALLRAETLRRLGRFDEAKAAAALIPAAALKTGSQARLGLGLVKTAIDNSLGRYQQALLAAQRGLRESTPLSEENWSFRLIAAEALTHTGKATEALTVCSDILQAPGNQTPVVAEAKLAKARALLELRRWREARDVAEEATQSFRLLEKRESEMLSSWMVAESYRGEGSMAESKAAEQKVQGILAGFKKSYGDGNYQIYIKRSEIAEILPGLAQAGFSSAALPKVMEGKRQ